jgi:hypothetical protein
VSHANGRALGMADRTHRLDGGVEKPNPKTEAFLRQSWDVGT